MFEKNNQFRSYLLQVYEELLSAMPNQARMHCETQEQRDYLSDLLEKYEAVMKWLNQIFQGSRFHSEIKALEKQTRQKSMLIALQAMMCASQLKDVPGLKGEGPSIAAIQPLRDLLATPAFG